MQSPMHLTLASVFEDMNSTPRKRFLGSAVPCRNPCMCFGKALPLSLHYNLLACVSYSLEKPGQRSLTPRVAALFHGKWNVLDLLDPISRLFSNKMNILGFYAFQNSRASEMAQWLKERPPCLRPCVLSLRPTWKKEKKNSLSCPLAWLTHSLSLTHSHNNELAS